jgi:hypothetical protein
MIQIRIHTSKEPIRNIGHRNIFEQFTGGDELRARGSQRDGHERPGDAEAGPLPHPAGLRQAGPCCTQVPCHFGTDPDPTSD